MKTEDQINADILRITLMIQANYPELSGYLSEMPVTIPNVKSPQINTQLLTDYYNSLRVLVEKYAQSHKN